LTCARLRLLEENAQNTQGVGTRIYIFQKVLV